MYLDELASAISAHIPEEALPEGGAPDLLRIYAVLLRAKGIEVTESDVHDAWSAWMATQNASHPSLAPYSELAEDVKAQDQVFVAAIRGAADETAQDRASTPQFSEILFPHGPPKDDGASRQVFDLYKIMVASSEALVNRRQGVNTFFLTMNGAFLTASGLIVQRTGDLTLSAMGIFVLALAGALLCGAWRSLINSFGQLNTGKFKVINAIERHFVAAIYAAEWEALGRGEDPRVYRSFTSREIWVPNALLVLHALTALTALLAVAGYLPFITTLLT